MYRVTNISLDSVFKKYSVTSLENLSEFQLEEVCRELRVYPKVTYDKEYSKSQKPTKFDVIKQIISDSSAAIYMGSAYWEETQRQAVEDRGGMDKLKTLSTGQQVYEFFDDCKLALNYLAPGKTTEVNWTQRWIEEVLVLTSLFDRLEILDLSTGNKLGRERVDGNSYALVDIPTIVLDSNPDNVSTTKKEEIVYKEITITPVVDNSPTNLKNVPWKDLLKMAKERGVATFGKDKEQVLAAVTASFQIS